MTEIRNRMHNNGNGHHGDIQTPPHADEAEAEMVSKFEALLAQNAADGKRRLEALILALTEASNNVNLVNQRARLAFTAAAKAQIAFRELTEHTANVTAEINNGLTNMDDVLKSDRLFNKQH